MCVCVCVVKEGERERERTTENEWEIIKKGNREISCILYVMYTRLGMLVNFI